MKNKKELLDLGTEAEAKAGFNYNEGLLSQFFEGTVLEKRTQQYVAPKISLVVLAMEEGIAAGSAVAVPNDSNGQVMQEWEVENIDKTILW
ncbi:MULTISPECIES: hypothetical protein [Sphingobacterium]|uniref:hypothetical protein n=1 Tax=Sphingobacterium TaxID=28453 RepID=UPI0011F2D6A5|nr:MULTISPECIES: hypothetical protein [Sphingobacterium]